MTDIGMRLMVEKGIRGEICHVIHRYVKVIDEYERLQQKNRIISYVLGCK